jgi:hypothetical protein
VAVYLLYYSVCDVQVQRSGDSSEHGRVLTKDCSNSELKKFFPLRSTNRLSAHNLAKGLHSMMPFNDILVDVLPFVQWNLLPILMNLLVHGRHPIYNRFHTLVPPYRFPLKRQCVYLRLLPNGAKSLVCCVVLNTTTNNEFRGRKYKGPQSIIRIIHQKVVSAVGRYKCESTGRMHEHKSISVGSQYRQG